MNIHKFISLFNIKRNVVRYRANKVISSLSNLLDEASSDVAVSLGAQATTLANEIIKSKDADKILHGGLLLLEGLKSVDWKSVSKQISYIQKTTKDNIKSNSNYKLQHTDVANSIEELINVFKN